MSKITQALLLFVLFITPFAHAEEPLRVGIKPSEPWVMYDATKPAAERQPSGFSVELWQEIAKRLGRTTEWVYFDTTNDLVSAVEKQQVDAGISALTVTAEREKRVNFSNSMYELGLQIMVSPEHQQSNPFLVMLSELGKLFTWQSGLLLLLMLITTAHIRLWIDRHDKHHATMPAGYVAGIRESFWWGLTMLLTWETPHSRGLARVVDLSWHLLGLILMSVVTAVVTTALTAQAVSGTIRTEKDLPGKTVAAVATDAPRQWLEQNGINVTPVQTLDEGMARLRKGEVDALVHDGPRLLYLANQANQKAGKSVLAVVPVSFNPQSYGIAFPDNSPLREPANQVLMQLREVESGNSFHQTLREKWLRQE